MPSTSVHRGFSFADAAALLRESRALNIRLPFTDDVSVLCTPCDVAGRTLPNRIVVQPMEGRDADVSGAPSVLTIRRYRRFAAGGSGLIWCEATAVVPDGRASPAQLCITRENVQDFARLVAETRDAAEARPVPLLILQLTHSGRYARPDGAPRPLPAQHNAILDPLTGVSPGDQLVSDDELDHLQEEYVQAAELAAAAGFDGVDVKACHGYLVSELLAACTRPHSKYGGSFENRSRFLREVIGWIRARVPGLIVTSRISACDGLLHPYGFGTSRTAPPRADLTEPRMLVQRLHELGCPLLNVSIGNPYYNPHIGRPFDTPCVGAERPPEHPLVGVARLLAITTTLQRAVPDLPLVGTGYSWLRQYFPQVGAAVVQTGGAALIGLGRAALAYPDCVRDLARNGVLDPHKVCWACSGCSQIMRDGGCVGCMRHDRAIYGPQYRFGRQHAPATAPDEPEARG